MIVYALFMCLQQPRPGIGRACILLSQRPRPTRAGLFNGGNDAYRSLAQCKRDFATYRPARGYEDVCMRMNVPAWEPVQ
jgi:hypothetical protein